MPGRVFELPAHPGPFPWTQIVASDSEANGSFGFPHRVLAENYTGDSRLVPAVTGLTGGGTALDGVATASGAVTTLAVREVLLGRQLYRYQLVNGADAEALPDIIRPDDYDAGSNNRVWRLLQPANRLAVAGVPGVTGLVDAPLTGVTLGAALWSAWIRVTAPGVAATLLELRAASGNANRLTLSMDGSGNLNLVLKDGGGTALFTASFSAFGARFGGQVVDLVVVRRLAAVGGGHELLVYAAGELLITQAVANDVAVASGILSVTGPGLKFLYRAALFNRPLSPDDIYRLGSDGIGYADRWGQLTDLYDSDFSAGTNSFSAVGGGTLTGNLDGLGVPSQDNVLRYTVPASPAAGQSVYRNVSGISGKSVRISGKVWLPTSNTGADQVTLGFLGDSVNTVVLTGKTTGWVDFSVDMVATFSLPQLSLTFAAGSGTQVAGDLLYVADLRVQIIGALLDLNLGIGAGHYIPDNGINGFNGDINLVTPTHSRPATQGQFCVIRTLDHAAISSTDGTTLLAKLPPNAAVMRVELERLVALDSGVTLSVGTSADNDRHIGATAADTLGQTLVNSLVQTVESGTAITNIYLRKSGATTVGSVRVRLIYELRGTSASQD